MPYSRSPIHCRPLDQAPVRLSLLSCLAEPFVNGSNRKLGDHTYLTWTSDHPTTAAATGISRPGTDGA